MSLNNDGDVLADDVFVVGEAPDPSLKRLLDAATPVLSQDSSHSSAEEQKRVASQLAEDLRINAMLQRFDPDAAAECFKAFLACLGFDVDNDPHMRDTAQRVVKMYRHELFRGVYESPPVITQFEEDNEDKHDLYDQMIYSGSITVRSTCSHHMLPISGTAHVAILLNDDSTLPGLSKYARVVHYFASRPQTQERLTTQVANHLETVLKPKGVGVLIQAQHFCQCHRGVREPYSPMITHALRGVFKHEPVKAEFLQLIQLEQKLRG